MVGFFACVNESDMIVFICAGSSATQVPAVPQHVPAIDIQLARVSSLVPFVHMIFALYFVFVL